MNHFPLLLQKRSTLYFIYSNQRTCFRHLCLHLHHHTPMENLRRYFLIHTRFYSTRMTSKNGALCFGQSIPLSGATSLLYLNTHEFDRGRPADKRDYIPDSRFHHRGTETSRVRTAVRTSTPVQERPSSTSSLAFLLRIDTVAYTPRNAYVSTSTQTQIDRRDRPCLTSP